MTMLSLTLATLLALATPAFEPVQVARAFPSLTEPDPRVVYDTYQAALESAGDFGALDRLLSARKRAYITQRTAGADDKAKGDMLRLLRDQFLVRGARLMHDDVGDERAILVYDGQIVLPDRRIVRATVGVVMVKEEGEWRVDHQRVSYRDAGEKGPTNPDAELPERRVEF